MQQGECDPNQMLTTEEAARLIGLKASTLAAWREDGSQPNLVYSKLGKAVRYCYADVIAFVRSRRSSSTLLARHIAPLSREQTPMPSAPKRRRAKPARTNTDGQQSLF